MPNLNTCEFDGCENPIRTKTYCNGHRLQHQRGQELRPLRRRGRPADPCTFEGCVRGREGHSGFCSPHNKQLRRSGRLKRVRSEDTSPAARFWWYVDKGENDECWVWNGLISDQGYGVITVEGKPERAHRYSWELHNGAIPEGAVLDHFRCYERACVNPAHLRVTDKLFNNQNKSGTKARSGYRNVYATRNGKFSVIMTANYQTYYGGTFETAELADERARELRRQVMPGAQW